MKIKRFHNCDGCGKPIFDKDEMLCKICKQRASINNLEQIRFLMLYEIHKPVHDDYLLARLVEAHNELMFGDFRPKGGTNAK